MEILPAQPNQSIHQIQPDDIDIELWKVSTKYIKKYNIKFHRE